MSAANKAFLAIFIAVYLAATLALRASARDPAATHLVGWSTDALNSASLFALLAWFGWPPLRDLLDGSIRALAEQLDAGRRRLEDARSRGREAEARLARIADDVAALEARERAGAEEDAARLAALAEAEARQIREHNELDQRREVELARRRVIESIATQAAERARQRIAGRLDAAGHESLSRALAREVAP